jgi:hypothetical protein
MMIRLEQVYKEIEVEIDGIKETQTVLDYTLKHTYENDVLVETMKVYEGEGYISQIQVYPIILPNPKDLIIEELKQLDEVLPRVAEDIISATVTDLTTLPSIVQERLARKVELRSQLKELI